jgi:transposase
VDTQIGVERLQQEDDPMSKSRRKYSREFKVEAVKQVVVQERTVASVAAGLGVHPSLLQRWKSQLESEGTFAFPGNGKASQADEEVLGRSHDLENRTRERVVPANHANCPACCRRQNAGVMLSL